MQYILALLFLAGFAVYLGVKHLPKLKLLVGFSNVSKEDIAFKDSMVKLTTDFNRTASTNINILEEKAKELRKSIELADKKIIQANSLMADLELASLRSRKEIPSPKNSIVKEVKLSASAGDKYRKIDELIDDGLPLDDIARRMGASRREVQLTMELKRRREQMTH